MSRPRVRFAASAERRLSIDGARTALFNWLYARAHRGTFILRIEDDQGGPPSPVLEAALLQDLQWLGLVWDEGIEAGGGHGPYRRSERLDRYREGGAALRCDGHAYTCFCAPDSGEAGRRPVVRRRDGADPGCTGACRSLPRGEAEKRRSGEPSTLRFDLSAAFPGAGGPRSTDLMDCDIPVPAGSIGDFVLLRRDGLPADSLATVLDDRAMAITHVIRGDDQSPDTARELLIHRVLGGEPPPVFTHLPIILDAGGAPLSEGGATASVAGLKEQGYPAEAVLNHLALLGWSAPGGQELLTVEELIALFDLERVECAPATLDRRRLDAIATRHMARLSPDRVGGLAAEQLAAAGLLPERLPRETLEWVGHLAMLYAERLPRMKDLVAESAFLFHFDPQTLRSDPQVRGMLDDPQARAVARAVGTRIGNEPLTAPRFQALADEVRRETGAKGRALYDPIRLALTGAASGPELVRLLPVIEEGGRLGLPRPVATCAQRARALCAVLAEDVR